MFEAVKEFLRTLSGEEGARGFGRDGNDDPRVAAAALLHHVAEADGVVSGPERARLKRMLAEAYGLSDSEAAAMTAAGEKADAEAVDLYHFTSVLLRRLSAEERLAFVQLLWRVAYVEGGVHELEDNIVWRVCELLGVSTRDRMIAKRNAEERVREQSEGA